MIDVRADDTLDIVFIPGVDIDTVTGREADEQALRIAVIAFFEQVIGEIDRPTIIQKIELYARRVVESLEFVEEIDSPGWISHRLIPTWPASRWCMIRARRSRST